MSVCVQGGRHVVYEVRAQCSVCQAPATVLVVPEGFAAAGDGISACGPCGIRMEATLRRVALAEAVQCERVSVPAQALRVSPGYRVALA